MRTCPECSNSYEDEVLHCPEDGLDLSKVEPEDELIGRMIGSYQVVKPLGKGGMGAVYLAQHPVIGSKVAIKFLHPQYATDAKIVDRFFNEAKAVNVIGHDNILKILDLSVTEDNRHYFVMEFLNGRALQDAVKPNVPMEMKVALPILLQTCEALQAAHDHQIIHRDLKPDNVYLITHKGLKNFVKVVDFGIAKLTDSSGASTGKTQTGMVMGTPAYMSPEQAGGMTSQIDGRSDIYSLGVMIYQMFTGKLPFPGSSFGEVLIGHLQLPPPPPRGYNPEIPEDLEAIILKTLAKKQDERQQSMRELHDELLAFMNAHGIPNELPAADPKDEKNEKFELPKGKSSPGQRTRASQPGQNTVQSRGQLTQQQRTKSSPGQATAIEMPPPPKRTGLYAGLGVAALLAVAAIGYVVYEGQQRAQAEVERIAKLAEEKDKAARKAAEEARRVAEEQKIAIAVASEPSGATVEASWRGGKETKVTPFILEAPKMVTVHFEFKKANYQDYTTDAVTDGAKQVMAKLTLDPSKVAAPAKASDGGSEKKRRKRTSDDDLLKDTESTIPVEF